MKKFLILGCILLILGSCNLLTEDEIMDERFSDLASGHSLYDNGEFSTLDTMREISIYINVKTEFVPDKKETWSNPKTTLTRGYGDCDDFAILFMNILYISTGVKANLLLVHTDDRSVVAGGNANHAIIEVNGVQYEPLWGLPTSYTIRYRYKFNEVFN